MKRFIEGEDRRQATLLPDSLEDYVTEDNPVRVVDVFIDELDLEALGFSGVVPEMTGRPAYHPATLLKIYLYGYLNRIQSSRRLERETQRNIELMWLTGRLMPDFKTIADFRRDSGPAIRAACAQFVVLCRQFNLFTRTIVAIDGSKFKAVNNRDKNFTVLTRAVVNLPSTSTVATRRAIYERARKAQLAQLGTLRPPLPESDIAREEEALDRAIVLVEAKFGVTDFTSTETPFAATTPAAATQQASAGSAPADAARTEASAFPRCPTSPRSFQQARALRKASRGSYLRSPPYSARFWRLRAPRS